MNKIYKIKKQVLFFWYLSPNFVFYFYNICLYFFAFIVWKIYKKVYFKFYFKFNGRSFVFFMDSSSDLAMLEEVFVDREYEMEYSKDIKNILDIGANIGDTAIYYSILFRDAKIFCIEPSPDNFEKLVKNTTQFPNISCFQQALSDKVGVASFYLGEAHFGYSLSKRTAQAKEIEVKTCTLQTFIRDVGIGTIDILKFDIEGFETVLLKQAKQIKFRDLAGEIHLDLVKEDVETLIRELNLLKTERKTLNSRRYILCGKI